MTLSLMGKVMETVNSEWRSQLAETILERWGYDQDSVYFFRASANFLFVFKNGGKRYFLRFNEASERTFEEIKAEMEIVNYLGSTSLAVAQPVESLNEKLVEEVSTEHGSFYAVVFEQLDGQMREFEDLDGAENFLEWGQALGALHKEFKKMPMRLRQNRPDWKEKLEKAKEQIPGAEREALEVIKAIEKWAEGLNEAPQNTGMIHYDFELDNLIFKADKVGILDFDDCIQHFYAADIAFALRDLFADGVNLDHPLFLAFMEGYRKETEVDEEQIRELSYFLMMHHAATFAGLCRTVGNSGELLPSLIPLREKLLSKMEEYRKKFAAFLELQQQV